jgi:nucleoside-diphosphate-sugar epimerase
MKLLVTGTDGYIGARLGPYLLERGYDVIGVDTGFYRDGWLYHDQTSYPQTLSKDIRQITLGDLRGVDAVVHMAELSNDPLGQLHPEITDRINHHGSVRLAALCKQAGVARLIYTSSCSVYGIGGDGAVKTELSELAPQTAYARCKVLVERDVRALADEHFTPVFLRNATAFGASPRMRFDVVLNNLAGLAHTTGVIKMTSDGTPWRPLVHVLDICAAIDCALQAPRAAVHNQIFNVGDTEHNYQVREIATIVAETFPGCALSLGTLDGDNRSYRVSFEKIRTQLPGFRCQYDARAGAAELRALFERIKLTDAIFTGRSYNRLKQLQHLIATEQLDQDLFWH